MEFTDTDGSRVYMNRVIHTDGTAEFTTVKKMASQRLSIYQITIIMYFML